MDRRYPWMERIGVEATLTKTVPLRTRDNNQDYPDKNSQGFSHWVAPTFIGIFQIFIVKDEKHLSRGNKHATLTKNQRIFL